MSRAALLTTRSKEASLTAEAWAQRGPVFFLEDGSAVPGPGSDLWVVDWGTAVADGAWQDLLAFHRSGGRLVVVGRGAFCPAGTVKYLRDLGWLDAWETAPVPPEAALEVGAEDWAFARDAAPPVAECASGLWRLASGPDPRGLMFDSSTVTAARISYPLRFTGAGGRTVAVPAVRLDPFEAGPILWLPFDAGRDWWASTRGQAFLDGALATLDRGRFRLVAGPVRGRFRPGEVPEVAWTLTPDRGASVDGLTLECRLVSADGSPLPLPPLAVEGPWDGRAPVSGTFGFPGLAEGFWKAELRLRDRQGFQGSLTTGFYHLGDEAVAAVLARVPRLRHDPQVSADVLSADGRPFPLHGVNYHVTDAYRDCFVRYNAWQNDRDFQVLAADGYNVVRTGNWQSFDRFFAADGTLRDEVLAHLEAFFLTAARHGFQVQFVLGAFVMNPWDRDQCPIHHPGQRAKTVAAFGSFARRFGPWPHVQIDAVNEPSYSVKGAWHLAKPSEDPHELARWRRWLEGRYSGNLGALWDAWGTAPGVPDAFASAEVPSDHRRYTRNYDRQDVVVDGRLADWYEFARQTYSEWVGELRQTVRAQAPDTLFMLGRDESLRVPAQQDEAVEGHLDVVNFHQWHRDSAIFSEYAFNRVRGLPCCGQEMGTYPYGDRRNEPRLTEALRARILERKLAYSFGNWLQWQAWNDPYMADSIERALGLYRADGTPTPLADTARALARFDEEHRDLVRGLDEGAVQVLVVFPTASYFSADAEAVFRTMVRTVRTWAERLRLGFDVVLEHRLDRPEQTGNPALVVVPTVLELGDATWSRLVAWAREGKAVLVSGNTERWRSLGVPVRSEPLAAVETLGVGDRTLEVSFRRSLDHFEPGTLYDRLVWADRPGLEVREIPLGAGRMLASPLPVEAADDDAVAEAVYRWALGRSAPVARLFEVTKDPGPRVGIFAQPYAAATRYTLVNEGAGARVVLRDLRTGASFEADVPEGRAVLFWVGPAQELWTTGSVRRLT